MLAPANFGSDLAALGQSVLGRIRSTFFNSNSHGEDFLESGKQVLQGLEPASPFQWGLSALDLHEEKTWFRPSDNKKKRCLPFVFAAGSSYGGIQAELLRSRKKPGTDGTVRICGTSLNTRKCTLEFVPGEETVPDEFNRKEMEISRGQLTWHEEHKFSHMPFGVFADFNHGTIVDPGDLKTSKRRTIRDRYEKSLGQLIVEVLDNHDMTKGDYEAMGERFQAVSKESYQRLRGSAKGKYQQFFFRVRDDVDLTVDDWYLDFSVWTPTQGADGKLSWKRHSRLSKAFDRKFESDFHTHSDDPSCRAMMLNCSELEEFVGELNKAKSALLMNVSAKSPVSNVRYRRGQYFMHDGSGLVNGSTGGGEYKFLFPNTTTLVDIILDRVQSDKILSISPS